jgi:hypothetical protein
VNLCPVGDPVHPERVRDKEATGAEIKQAGIVRGDTTVRPDSRLFRWEEESWLLVPDSETIKVHDGERFRAQGKQEDSLPGSPRRWQSRSRSSRRSSSVGRWLESTTAPVAPT